MISSVVLWYKHFNKASVRLRRRLGTWMLMACLVFQRDCFHHLLLCWKIEKCLLHCQTEYKSPHSYSRLCKILDKACERQFCPVCSYRDPIHQFPHCLWVYIGIFTMTSPFLRWPLSLFSAFKSHLCSLLWDLAGCFSQLYCLRK